MDEEPWLKENLDRFNKYVMNDIPIRLIRLSDMKLVGRNDVRKRFQDCVPRSKLPYPPALIVHYAILSHRWLDEGEPTYEDMTQIGNASGPGYEKLKKFCEKAQEYNMEFAWSDTCCIDKTSSTELDESIRSMFRWYANSQICIVHLAQSETIDDIMADEWTERGWTLQELLAPSRIRLFNKHWMPMTGDENDKNWKETEVMKMLSRATGIPRRDLSTFIPGPEKVDERMTWAARRKTTRVEDVAYSLMGIFKVSLQIAYGEGGDLAFCRLFEAIMQGGDPSVFNWTGHSAIHHSSNAIPRSPQNFAHRTLNLLMDRSLGRLEMAMTSIGLRVPLVVFPLSFSSSRELASGEIEVTAECSLCPTIKIKFVLSSLNFHDMHELALGIVTYSLRSSQVPRIPGRAAGFILERKTEDSWLSLTSRDDLEVCQPSPRDFDRIEIISPPDHEFMQWRKANGTGLVEVDFPNVPGDSFFYISRKYLEIIYL
ncbi:hypothetical protein M405DRAFT_805851 [Rhizopogon salebrosus TDB-379]|nr:hypothetical protein M405DRAFT_805851 [Rhizopogon salebrosus TDB-379]